MTFDPSDGISLTELIRLVRKRTGDFPQKRRQVESGDAVLVDFRLRDTPHEATGVAATVSDVAATGTPDYDSGWFTFDSAPALGDKNIVISYSNVVWSDERIQEAINSAIDEMFGDFYVKGYNDAIATTGSAEILAETAGGDELGPEDRITKVEYWNGSRFVRTDRWSVAVTDKKYVRFENAPETGTTLRISYAVRPGNLDSGAQTLEGTAGLPSRAKEPIVLLACAALIEERMHHRIRDDRGHNTQGDAPVKSYEIQNDTQFLRADAARLLSKLGMDPLLSRVVY